jgi:tetratricopeptide (TPR) repeat protein
MKNILNETWISSGAENDAVKFVKENNFNLGEMKRARLFSLFYSLILLNMPVSAQYEPPPHSTKSADSLRLAFKTAKHDTGACSALLKWGEIVVASSPDSAAVLWSRARAIAEKNLAIASLSPLLKKTYLKHLALGLDHLGYVYDLQGKTIASLDFHRKSLTIQESLGDKKEIANSLHSIAFIYNSQGDIPKALDYFSKSLKIFEAIGDKVGTATSLNTTGLIYYNQGEIAKAIEHYNKSLKIRTEIGDQQGIATSLNNIGAVYRKQGDMQKALQCYEKSLRIREEIGDQYGAAFTLNNLGFLYKNLGDLAKANNYYNRSLKIREEIGDKKGIAGSLNNIAAIYFKEKNYSKTLEYSLKSLQLSRELGYPDNIRGAARMLSAVYKTRNDYRKALEYYELFVQMRDSVNNEESRNSLVKNQLKYEYEKKTATDSVAHAKENEVKKAQILKQETEIKAKKNQQYALFGGLALVLVFAGFMYNRFRITQKQKILIEKQKRLVEDKQKEILDSIYYARRIQQTLLTSEKYIGKKLNALTNRAPAK